MSYVIYFDAYYCGLAPTSIASRNHRRRLGRRESHLLSPPTWGKHDNERNDNSAPIIILENNGVVQLNATLFRVCYCSFRN
jgi:hypothetical protein